MVVISVYEYDVEIIKAFRWESGFLKVFHTLCTNGSTGYLMQLSVKRVILILRTHLQQC